MTQQALCWLDGNILPANESKIPVLDHGLLYGDGVFEGIRFYQGKAFMLDAHLSRLQKSAKAIALGYPWTKQQLAEIIAKLITATGMPDGYIRLIITRGEGALGIDPRTCPTPRLIVIADQLQLLDPAIRQQGANVIIAATRRLDADGLDPRIKSLNYLNHVLARLEANHANADEAILLNRQGHVTEGSADNIFIVQNNVLLTPPVTDGALNGITRQLVLQLAEESDIAIREQTLSPYDLYTADECFLTGTGAELIPVARIDNRPVANCPGNVFETIDRAFHTYIKAS